MRFYAILDYLWQDLSYYRGRHEILIGLVSILFATTTLLLLFSLASSVGKIVDQSLQQARPILGVIKVSPRHRGTPLTEQQIQLLQQLKKAPDSELEGLSLLIGSDVAFGFEIWPFDYQTNPKAESISFSSTVVATDDPMLVPKYGTVYVKNSQHVKNSSPFQESPNSWQFNIIVNRAFLEDNQEQLGLTQQTLDNILTDQQQLKLPVRFIRSLTVSTPNGTRKINPGIHEIPVTGIVTNLRDSAYPDIWFHLDVARAYYYQHRRAWHPSYALQFDKAKNTPLLPSLSLQENEGVVQIQGELAGQKIDEVFSQSDYIPLPSPKQADSYLKYHHAFLWLKNYQSITVRETLIKKVADTPVGQTLKLSALDYSLSKALNRITPTVDIFVTASAVILMVLSFFTMMLFGFGFVLRKRHDIGLLASGGSSGLEIARLFLLEIITVAVIGILLGILLAFVTTFFIENWANELVQHIIPKTEQLLTGQITSFPIKIGSFDSLKTIGFILGAAFLGGLFPTLQATFVDPADQLKTQD